MSRLTKNQKAVQEKYDRSKLYSLQEACELLKEITYTKFDASVEITANLGVDPRKANQMIRGVVTLPHGTGKVVRVLVLCTPDKENEAKEAGADYVGLDEYIDKIKGGWTDVDVIICTPSVMAKVGAIGRILGPRGLMPNPKTGTVTMDVANAVKEVKAGKIDFKVDKTGIIHAAIGKISFTPEQIADNARTMISAVLKLKPQSLKGTYLKGATRCTTMSPAVKLDPKAFTAEQECPNFYITDIAGLNAEKTSKLRRDCFEQGIKLTVVKNTLFEKVLKDSKNPEYELLFPTLSGNTAIMYAEGPSVPAKLIKKYQKAGEEKPALKGAYVQECAFVGADKLDELIAIKSREELIADVIALLQSPIKQVVSALQSAGGTVAGIVKTLSEKEEK